jgi:hypothetical protein
MTARERTDRFGINASKPPTTTAAGGAQKAARNNHSATRFGMVTSIRGVERASRLHTVRGHRHNVGSEPMPRPAATDVPPAEAAETLGIADESPDG